MKSTDEVSNLINCLTKNEDQRQELWDYYLSGNSPASFAAHLQRLEQEYDIDRKLQQGLLSAIDNPPSIKFSDLLSRFSDVERSVVCLLALGLTVNQVSKYKGITEIRIRQVIAIIRDNDCWEEIYGVKEKIN